MKKPGALVPLRTGGAPAREEGLLELLLACHARIRHFARLAFVVGARPELPAAEVVTACGQCLRYFQEALPLHVRDEEDSLAPRLAGFSPAVDTALAQLRAQHLAHEASLEGLIAALRQVERSPGEPALRRQLSLLASRVETDLEEHLRLEETQLFPVLEEALTEAERAEAVRELRARRAR